MIWIEVVNVVYPASWSLRSAQALSEVEVIVGEGGAVADAISTRSGIWRELATQLAALSHNKCWYCESEIVSFDLAVDHFRPKGKVHEDPSHGGYWWLAFEIANFRLVCTYCNERRNDPLGQTSGGKGAHFPLLPGSTRVLGKSHPWTTELPLLLDPTDFEDPPLLNFLSDGEVVPSRADSVETERAVASIEIYHLRHQRLINARARTATEVTEAVQRAALKYRDLEASLASDDAAVTAALRNEWKEDVKRILSYIRNDSRYAATARAMVRQLSGPHPFLEDVLSQVA